MVFAAKARAADRRRERSPLYLSLRRKGHPQSPEILE
jgi:hypothetical protein